jgi:secreted trypsin-like serine protease
MKENLKSLQRLACYLIVFAGVSCGGGGSGGDGPSNDACGTLGLTSRALKIIDGTVCTGLNASPVVRVAVFDANARPLGLCSGTMITPTAALTAAHCILPGTFAAAVIYGDPGSTVNSFAHTVNIHPGYQPIVLGSVAAFNDVAILQLRDAVPVPTLPILASTPLGAGEIISIYGYGMNNEDIFDFQDLRSGEMEVAGVTENHVFANFDGGGSNTCQGDSGGPAVSTIGGAPALVGVTSSGSKADCSEGDVSLFINLQTDPVLNFIRARVPGVATR